MSVTQILFWFLSVLAVSGAVMVVASRNPVHSILFLIITFFAISGHYILLNAQFLAIVNIIVYAGAIMVLFLFVVMLMNLNHLEVEKRSNALKLAAVVAAGLLLTVLSGAVQKADQITLSENTTSASGMVENLGIALYKNYLLPFELASVLFLAAMVGAVYLSKKNLNETQA